MIKSLDTLEVITFFVEDLPSTIAFYKDVLGLETVYHDDVSEVMRLQNLTCLSISLSQD
jgi:catechol 2,3-dioxygenase-like lactoylglutathione lyase family enzyme